MHLILHRRPYLTHDADIVESFKLLATDTPNTAPNIEVIDTATHPDYADIASDTVRMNTMHMDFGGAVFQEEHPVEMEVLGRRFSFYAHQHLTLLNALNRALERIRVDGTVAVHGWIHIYLVAEEVARALRENILSTQSTLAVLERGYLMRWEEAMTDLRSNGFVAVPEDKEPDA